MSDATRREFLQATALAGVTALLPNGARAGESLLASADAVVFIMMTGGPSQHDTFDPKPEAPSQIRSPFAPIRTTVPGLHVTELFPHIAKIAHKLAFVRSAHHADVPMHEVGYQYLNSGKLFRDGPEWPSVGAVVDNLHRKEQYDPFRCIVSPDRRVYLGLKVSHGQDCGWLRSHSPMVWTWDDGVPTLIEQCERAFHALSSTTKVAVLNQFTTVFGTPTWDCHADGGRLATTLRDIRDTVAPSFDFAFARLVTALDEAGLLERTLVVATGEFGRTPRFNCSGGRDHWPAAWTTLFAGGGVQGGRIVGSTDADGAMPKDRPVHARDIPATIFRALGYGPETTIPGPTGAPVLAYDGQPIRELFA